MIVAALVVAACGQLPRPFAHDGGEITMPDELRPADGAGVVVDATRCSAALGGAVIAALHDIEVPASAAGGNLGSLWLNCHVVSGYEFGWTLSDAEGATLGEF
ncbi:hypothetical protein IIC65_09745, partial [Candidatus Sumerlaeota bacterium]|nr:hypothetical protein [Candidatus Sumerlaeota bacterium]